MLMKLTKGIYSSVLSFNWTTGVKKSSAREMTQFRKKVFSVNLCSPMFQNSIPNSFTKKFILQMELPISFCKTFSTGFVRQFFGSHSYLSTTVWGQYLLLQITKDNLQMLQTSMWQKSIRQPFLQVSISKTYFWATMEKDRPSNLYWNKFVYYYYCGRTFSFSRNIMDLLKLTSEGVLIQMVQNFWNFFISSFFWLTYIPLYERIFPIFDTNVENQGTESKDNNNNNNNNDQARSNASVNIPTRIARYDINNGNREARSISDQPNKDQAHFSSNDLENGQARYIENHPGKGQDRVGSNDPDNGQAFFADVPQFNATFIYYGVYSPTGVAIQLVQNFFNWFSSTMFWLSYTPFYTRMLPIFSPANNQRSIESVFNPVPYFKYLLYHQEETNDQVSI